MNKELIITIIIIILIIGINVITQNNTNNTITEMNSSLNGLREELIKDNKNGKDIKSQMKEIETLWQKTYYKMAYYIEHDELEKVETELTKLRADIEIQEYKTGVENLDSCVFILKHIRDKHTLKIVNIF